jgi:hypothetical protein
VAADRLRTLLKLLQAEERREGQVQEQLNVNSLQEVHARWLNRLIEQFQCVGFVGIHHVDKLNLKKDGGVHQGQLDSQELVLAKMTLNRPKRNLRQKC